MGNIMVDTSKKYVAWCNENKITERHIHIVAINLSIWNLVGSFFSYEKVIQYSNLLIQCVLLTVDNRFTLMNNTSFK
jgi:hypothetical protein